MPRIYSYHHPLPKTTEHLNHPSKSKQHWLLQLKERDPSTFSTATGRYVTETNASGKCLDFDCSCAFFDFVSPFEANQNKNPGSESDRLLCWLQENLTLQ